MTKIEWGYWHSRGTGKASKFHATEGDKTACGLEYQALAAFGFIPADPFSQKDYCKKCLRVLRATGAVAQAFGVIRAENDEEE